MATVNSARLLSHVRLSETPRPAAPQAPLSTGLPRRGHGWVTVSSFASRVTLLSLNNCSSDSGESSVLTAEQCPLGAEAGAGLQAGRKSGPVAWGGPWPAALSSARGGRALGLGGGWTASTVGAGQFGRELCPSGAAQPVGRQLGRGLGSAAHTHTQTRTPGPLGL